jgi:hypothetical protein
MPETRHLFARTLQLHDAAPSTALTYTNRLTPALTSPFCIREVRGNVQGWNFKFIRVNST